MPTLLVRHADLLVTMDGARREIAGGGLFARDGWVEQVGPSSTLPDRADEILDLSGHLALPGLVNTHHHLYQTLTRSVPAAQDADLFHWLRALYPIWARLKPDDIRLSTQIGLAELALSGCTTASDHLYLYPNACRLDDEIAAAAQVGIRLHAARGSMSLGESQGGLPPDSVVEKAEAILDDCQRVIEAHHDPKPGAMLRIVVAPCSPFSVTADLMRESAALARAYGVSLHTHLAETLDEERFCLETFGHRPLAYAETLGWSGADVWFAHAVHMNPGEVSRMAASGSGVAHCPSSNMRLASGIAPLRRYRRAGVRVGLGVDGSASNDSSHMLAEVRQALLLSRLGAAARPEIDEDAALLTARQALELATRGGAAVLGRDDLGSLEPGKCADFIAVRLDRLEYAGGLHDPLAAAVFCAPATVDVAVVHGRKVVDQGRLVGIDLPPLIEQHNRAAARLVRGE
jgi:cytosine/adenosine deaminase-related metal-dependent hydrolase